MTDHEKWLQDRKKGIGGSDAAAIVGMSPYKTNVQLWEEKTGRRESNDISSKSFVQYGKEAEKHLRELFALDYPQYMVRYDEYGMIANNSALPFAFATLDGELSEMDVIMPLRMINRTGILEIKTTEIMRSGQWEEWNNRIPQHYYIQVIHQLLATGYSFAWLKAQIKYHDKDGNLCAAIRHYYIERESVEHDIEWLAQKEATFWKCVENNTKPALILPEL